MADSISNNITYPIKLQDFTSPPQTYLSTHPNLPYTLLATATLIFTKPTSFNPAPKILLLQRASHDSHPNQWEPPGGACDDTDSSILHAAARELSEETGLQAKKFVDVIGEPHVFRLRSGKFVGRYCFLVEVDDVESVKLDPNEHQDYVWVAEEEVREGKMRDGKEMKITTKEVVDKIVMGFAMIKQ